MNDDTTQSLSDMATESAEIILNALSTHIEQLRGPVITVHHKKVAAKMLAIAMVDLFSHMQRGMAQELVK